MEGFCIVKDQLTHPDLAAACSAAQQVLIKKAAHVPTRYYIYLLIKIP